MDVKDRMVTIDGNEAAAYIAYKTSEICVIYPITPSSPMAEQADAWASKGVPNIWNNVPNVTEMHSEAGVAGTVHGALQSGALTTTFTASQGLLLMLPNMYKIAGELMPTVFHVAARSLATQALSIFGDHSDVMSARMTGFAMLASSSVQEVHDMALVAHAATLKSKIPFVHFFDGFRTSHEVNKIKLASDEQIKKMINNEFVFQHREEAMNPNKPTIRGTAQNPDVYFQGRETSNKFYKETITKVEETMEELEKVTGRKYKLFDYYGVKNPDKVIVIMGSGGETVKETIDMLEKQGEKVGIVQVRLYRPFSNEHLLKAVPKTTKSIAVLDRTKEPGSVGEPLYLDVLSAFSEALNDGKIQKLPKIIGGRYGLSSKEFTPAMVKAIYDELEKEAPKNHFTIGINDDVTNSSLEYDTNFNIETKEVTRALFFGLGSDGTVGANKNTIKIIGENTPLYTQGYFVYDSKKAGSRTISHLRFGEEEINSPYLIQSANFIACHNFEFVKKIDILKKASDKATLLLNSPFSAADVWNEIPQTLQQKIIDHNINFYVINASKVAKNTGMGRRINTVMQTCFFALSNVLPKDEAIKEIKNAIEKTYSRKGEEIVQKNFKAVDETLKHLEKVDIPTKVGSNVTMEKPITADSTHFVEDVLSVIISGDGDDLPVSKIPVNGVYPSGTSRYEKKNLTDSVPIWDNDICIQCGRCSFVCPHSVIRTKSFDKKILETAPKQFKSAPLSGRGFPNHRYTLQVIVDECTGCALCVETCPVKDPDFPEKRAINMGEKAAVLKQERENFKFFEKNIPINDRKDVNFGVVRGVQYLEPLFEFSGACAGCGETPYVRTVSQLFGDRLMIANATGCSSIYGGNLPTTPWTKNEKGRGPAWANSLFEDNAEFGLGMRLTANNNRDIAKSLCLEFSNEIGERLVEAITTSIQDDEVEINAQRARVEEMRKKLKGNNNPKTKHLLSLSDFLIKRSVWLMGGDGWAYDIGYGGLDHVISSGKDVNILVLDTEVYSNTGGQMSKSTPIGVIAKFAAAGKTVSKKDLALQAISYGSAYVARIAFGANQRQTLQALREAEQFPGTSLVIAYSACIEHGIDMSKGLEQQKLAVDSGYWPLMRYNPVLKQQGKNPLILDSQRPKISLEEYAYRENRYKTLLREKPEIAKKLMKFAQEEVYRKWDIYEKMSKAEITTEEFSKKLEYV